MKLKDFSLSNLDNLTAAKTWTAPTPSEQQRKRVLNQLRDRDQAEEQRLRNEIADLKEISTLNARRRSRRLSEGVLLNRLSLQPRPHLPSQRFATPRSYQHPHPLPHLDLAQPSFQYRQRIISQPNYSVQAGDGLRNERAAAEALDRQRRLQAARSAEELSHQRARSLQLDYERERLRLAAENLVREKRQAAHDEEVRRRSLSAQFQDLQRLQQEERRRHEQREQDFQRRLSIARLDEVERQKHAAQQEALFRQQQQGRERRDSMTSRSGRSPYTSSVEDSPYASEYAYEAAHIGFDYPHHTMPLFPNRSPASATTPSPYQSPNKSPLLHAFPLDPIDTQKQAAAAQQARMYRNHPAFQALPPPVAPNASQFSRPTPTRKRSLSVPEMRYSPHVSFAQ